MDVVKKIIIAGLITGGIGAGCWFANILPKQLLLKKLPKEKQEYFENSRDSLDYYSNLLNAEVGNLRDSLALYDANLSYHEEEYATLELDGYCVGAEVYSLHLKNGTVSSYSQSAYTHGLEEGESDFDYYTRRTARHGPLICLGFWGDGKKVLKWYGQNDKFNSVLWQRFKIRMLNKKIEEFKEKYSREKILESLESIKRSEEEFKLNKNKTRDQILEEKYKRQW
ncbi:MAG: hypothetical protein LBJ73_02455 [Rickettsiales bacterium]|jgi:hypothetical protein|nr:hypothetical protein [Rickettsiales bacterium]